MNQSLAASLGSDYDRIAAELAPLMEEVCQSIPTERPPITVLDRQGFIDTNLTIARRLFVPLEQLRAQIPDSRASVLGRRMLNRYVGELFGFMSQRVLGQYDPVLMLPPSADPQQGEQGWSGASTGNGTSGGAQPHSLPTPSLYLVEPNVVAFERAQRADPEGLRRWLILHEMTHAWQFGNHPWLRDHVIGLVNEMLVEGVLAQARDKASPMQLATRLPNAVRQQLRGVARIQAVMSLLEGYSNFVMHRVGRRHLANFDEIEAAFERRRQQRTALERLITLVTGLSLKLRQYGLGERFAEVVADAAGIDVLNRVWEGPQLLPTLEELRNPQIWLGRARSQ
jgi:coenzyme F420 biosynthesis associated uncharacterized protein